MPVDLLGGGLEGVGGSTSTGIGKRLYFVLWLSAEDPSPTFFQSLRQWLPRCSHGGRQGSRLPLLLPPAQLWTIPGLRSSLHLQPRVR